MSTVLTLFGTRPEIIKLAPVIAALERPDMFRTVNVCSSQHTDLLRPFIGEMGVRVDHDLNVMTPSQTLSDVLVRVVSAMAPLIERERPDMVVVQGDTTTAIAGALAAFYARIPVGHVEAGLRTHNRDSPYPEEMNRRLITQVADLHFAATSTNVATLEREGVDPARILLTGNPVVDALHGIRARATASGELADVLARVGGRRLIALTTHRRENFGAVMTDHLRALRRFVEQNDDIALIFPVHPNPSVRGVVEREFGGAVRVHCIEPLPYAEFVHLLSRTWLIVSDSGGVQEEAPTLGKPLLVLRDTTERPEVIEAGVGRLVGHSGDRLEVMLGEALADTTWAARVCETPNPFGDGRAGERIADAIGTFLRRRA